MKKLFLIFIVFAFGIFLIGCGPVNLTVEKISFNKLDSFGNPEIIASEAVNSSSNTIMVHSEAAYFRGQIVLIVMDNVQGFAKGSDSLNWMELDVDISGPDKKIIFSKQNMLGDKGHVNLPGNMARAPFASYTIPNDAKPGKYNFKIKISDKVSKKYRIIKGQFAVN